MFTSRFSYSFSRTSTTSLWKKYFVAYYSSETESQACFCSSVYEHCKQSDFQFENFYFLCGTVVLTFDAMVSTGFVSWMNVLQFKTIPLLCKGADYLTDELPVQSFVILRKRNNLYFWLGFTRNQVFLSAGCWTRNSKDVDCSFQFCSIPPMWHWPVCFPCWALPLKMKWSSLVWESFSK